MRKSDMRFLRLSTIRKTSNGPSPPTARPNTLSGPSPHLAPVLAGIRRPVRISQRRVAAALRKHHRFVAAVAAIGTTAVWRPFAIVAERDLM